MENLIGSLLNLGIGGVMAATVVWFLYHILTKTIPEMMASFQASLGKLQDLFERTNDKLLARVDQQAEQSAEQSAATISRLEAIDQHTKANADHLAILAQEVNRIKARQNDADPQTHPSRRKKDPGES